MSRVFTLLFHDVYADSPDESGFTGHGTAHYKVSTGAFERYLSVLKRTVDHAPVLVGSQLSLESEQDPFALTVDDGGISYYTIIADRLEDISWRGHCFVTTGRIGQRGFLDKQHLRDLHNRGHVIGSHSVSHPPRMSACKWKEMLYEWDRSRKTLQDILGTDVKVASIPGGYLSRRVAEAARHAGYECLFTSEPQLNVGNIDGCAIYGRYTIRRGVAPGDIARLAERDMLLRCQHWVFWNGKKILKGVLGTLYPQISRWIVRSGQ